VRLHYAGAASPRAATAISAAAAGASCTKRVAQREPLRLVAWTPSFRLRSFKAYLLSVCKQRNLLLSWLAGWLAGWLVGSLPPAFCSFFYIV